MAENRENKIPEHVAIILDGNGRWAKKRLMPRFVGHRHGALNLKDVTNEAMKLGIKNLTVYCFSTENWKRNEKEVSYLMSAPLKFYKRYKESLYKSQVRLRHIGRRDRLSKEFLEMIEDITEKTKDHTGICLNLCIDYGGRDEITTAAKKLALDVKNGVVNPDDITEDLFGSYLYTKDLPPVDLMIRTSGECRLSNYLLWELAYSELFFTNTLWPDFGRKDLEEAILSYQGRTRRFGGLTEDANNKN